MAYKSSGIEVVFSYDKVSKFYLTESGDIVTDLNQERLMREFYFIKAAKKKGKFVVNFKSISPIQKSRMVSADNQWAEQEHNAKCGSFNRGSSQMINLLIK